MLKNWNFKLNTLFGHVRAREFITFAGNMSAMLVAGLPLSRALRIATRGSGGRAFNQTIETVYADVQAGLSLSQALSKHPRVFSHVFSAMAAAGEQSGNLAGALQNVAGQLAKSASLKRAIRGALIYPTIILCLMFGVGVLMLVYVVPTLTATFVQLGVKLPASTQAIISVSDFLNAHAVLLTLALAVLGGAIVYGLKTARGRRMRDNLLLQLPAVRTLTKKTNTARTARTLASLIGAGVDMVSALETTAQALDNVYYQDVLFEVKREVQRGVHLATVFEAHARLFPPLMLEMVEVGEETGRLHDMLEQVASFFEQDVAEASKNFSTIIEPVLMIVIGLAVGIFAIAIIEPIYSIGNSF